ncbi:MAG: STAS domain-containing protein [Thermoflexales bacterium]|nr:STAS domain-containing protein [Thermoflexales bacterium]
MKVSHEQLADGVMLVRGDGRLDAATVDVFEGRLQDLLAEKHVRLVVDLAHVDYISSSGLRALLTTRRLAREQAGDVLVCCMSPRVRQVFDMIGFSSVFGVYDDLPQAQAAFAAIPS